MDFRDIRLILLADWEPIQLAAMAAALIVGTLMTLFALRARWSYRRLPELPEASDGGDAAEKTVIVIPARNEEKNIERALASFRADRVVVVDDGSTDRTADLAAARGALVVEAPPVKRGSYGKPSACYAGAEMAPPSEYLMFADADTWYEPDFLPSMAAAMARDQRAMMSVFPRLECATLAEKAIVPYAFALYFCGVGAESSLDPMSSPAALMNGQCLFFKRSAYEFIGGHKMVLRAVVDDVELARVAKRHQLPVTVYRAEKLASARMYAGWGQIWEGLTKNSFRFLILNPMTGLRVVLASAVMSCWLPVLLFQFYVGAWASGALFLLLPAVLFYPWYGSLTRAILVPVGIYAFLVISLKALVHTTFGIPVRWKGRSI